VLAGGRVVAKWSRDRRGDVDLEPFGDPPPADGVAAEVADLGRFLD
jgi:hypothetical protein